LPAAGLMAGLMAGIVTGFIALIALRLSRYSHSCHPAQTSSSIIKLQRIAAHFGCPVQGQASSEEMGVIA
jgi:hypothetical protein